MIALTIQWSGIIANTRTQNPYIGQLVAEGKKVPRQCASIEDAAELIAQTSCADVRDMACRGCPQARRSRCGCSSPTCSISRHPLSTV